MGLGYHLVEALIRETQYRQIAGDVMVIGRQTVYFTPQEILQLLRQHGVDVGQISEGDIELDTNTIDRLSRYAGQDLISDAALFRLLGVPRILALDHSGYEGAEIIHDLTAPIPDNLRECADFIIDGSTLDNVFDPATAISNLAAMLRPGGRLITTNVFSNHYEQYSILSPLWFLDYFVYNAFEDCKIYVVMYGEEGEIDQPINVFTIDFNKLLTPSQAVSTFAAPGLMATIVMAEKGTNSTSHLKPSQQQYRSAAEWQLYRQNLTRISQNSRPHLVRTAEDISFFGVQGGHAICLALLSPWLEQETRGRNLELASHVA